MGLPIGFQPRPCPFCGGRAHMNREVDQDAVKKWRVTCLFCQADGPAAATTDDAWLSWNGQGVQCPSMLGSPTEMLL